jgi:hypothetical protein
MKSLVAALAAALLSLQPQPPAALHIVVIEGEGAVNIIQQKTAVRPLVEVRDRNNLPVAGATVTFSIGGGQPAAFAGGLQTMTVTTNAAGQAAASGLHAISSGAFQIQVQAAYQGQIATAAISQTNFATAAAAAQAGGASSGAASSGAATGAVGGTGGGISGATLGIVGAAVAGGAVAATQVGGGGDEEDRDDGVDANGVVNDGGGPNGPPFNGPFSGQLVITTVTASANQSSTCVSTRNVGGTLKIQLRTGIATGNAELRGAESEVSVTASNLCSPQAGTISPSINVDMSGPPTSLAFTSETSFTGPTPNTGSVTATVTWRFTGAVSGNTITGTLTYQVATRGTNLFNGVSSTITGNGSTSFAVTLTR